MKLAWMFCLLLAGKLTTASPGEDKAVGGETNSESSYMMAFPMDDDHIAEESAQAAVKMLAETLADAENDDDDDEPAEVDDKKEEESSTPVPEEKKEDQTEQPEPMVILQAQLDTEEEAQKPSVPQRPFFKSRKIEELRKILGFPPQEGPASKSKPIPQEKPKVFQGLFNKPRPKFEPKIEQSPLGGMQINLRREDRMRPFGFPMLPLKRDDNFRPFGIPDLVQAASSLIRRAIVDENNENDISKDDKEEEEAVNQNEPEESGEEEDEESLMIVPIPDPKEMNQERPPLFRRLPLPFPASRPSQQYRSRLPLPPLTPVAFFLPIAQQIMQNIRSQQPRSQPPLVPIGPMHQAQNFIPIQTHTPIIPLHHAMQQQQIIHIPQPSQQIPLFHQPAQQPQQFMPFIPLHQAAFHVPVLTPLPNMQRPTMRQIPRRMPVHAQPPQITRRIPFPSPMSRMAAPPQPHPQMQPQLINSIIRRPLQAAANLRSMQRVVRPPMHPVILMMPMPVPNMHVPFAQPQQQIPIYHKPQHIQFMPQPQHVQAMSQPQHVQAMSQPQHVQVMPQQRQWSLSPEEERVIFLRPDQEEQDDDQEVLILVPSDEVEVSQRPPMLPPQLVRQVPTPIANPLQRIKLLRDLLLARQANRQGMMPPQNRPPRVVEIVQQQLRIFPAHHQQIHPSQLQRADPSELHPVYVPYPGPQ